MGGGPLDFPRLRAIEQALDGGDVASAQKQLAEVGPDPEHAEAVAYLSTRILFQLGRVTRAQAAIRLREVLKDVDDFPEAANWLRIADERPESSRPARGSAPPFTSGDSGDPDPKLADVVLTLDAPGRRANPRRSSSAHRPRLSNPSIPRAGRLPRISTPPDLTPSYAPEENDSEESSRAGSYSEHPPRVEIVEPARRSSAPPPSSSEMTPVPVTQPEKSKSPRIRSGPPAAVVERGLPTSLFEIAELADSGHLGAALRALEALPAPLGAEHTLLYARLLQRATRNQEALAILERMESAPLLDPEVRAAVSRQLLEIGQVDRARVQAERAFADDELSGGARAALVAVLARAALETEGDDLERALELLAGDLGTGPETAALMSARALGHACGQESQRAVTDALRALHLDPHSVNALAALALGSAQLCRVHDAQQAWLRLDRADAGFAQALAPKIDGLGIALTDLESVIPGHSLPAESSPWEPVEMLVADAEFAPAIVTLENLARDTLAQVAHRGGGELMVLGTVGATFLTRVPLFRDFAPFDLSLHSLSRLDHALATLYSPRRPKEMASDHYSLLLLAGAYFGETLRQCGQLSWRGSLTSPNDARVLGAGIEWHPFQLVEQRMMYGAPLPQANDLGFSNHSRPRAWSHRMLIPEVPPCPWDPEQWPTLRMVERLGRAMSRSVVARFCADHADGPLDRTIASLSAVDSFLALVAPAKSQSMDPSLARRLAVLLGSYVGETLRAALGGTWHDSGKEGADAFELVVSPAASARPIAVTLKRVQGESTSMSSYVTRFMDKRA